MSDVFDPSETPAEYRHLTEIGDMGFNRMGNTVYEEFLPQLQYPRAAKIFKEMADNDPTIGAVLYMIEQLIRKAGWEVIPASDSAADKAAADFLQECMDDMRDTWSSTVSEMLSMLPYGFSFHEIVYKLRKGPKGSGSHKSKYSDSRVGWAALSIRAQSTLWGWEFADNGEVLGFIQSGPPHFHKVTIPMEKGLLFQTRASRGNPESKSLLRNAYRPWFFKKRIEEIEGIGIERDLAGLPVITPPEGVDIWDPNNPNAMRMKGIAENLVRNVRRDRSEGIVKPAGWVFELMSTGGSRQFDTNAIINRYDNRIAVTMLADIVMMGGDKVGSFALGEVKKSLLAASLEGHVGNIADELNNRAVPQLFELNHFPGITELPKIVPGEVETPDIKELAFLLRSAGLQVSKDLPVMNLVRRLISVEPITQEELDEWYAAPEPETKLGPDGNPLSSDIDPVGHSMDDNAQLGVEK